jgi:hypothetical protein
LSNYKVKNESYSRSLFFTGFCDIKIGDKAYIEIKEDESEQKIKIVGIKDPNKYIWKYVLGLHIHHKYYQKTKLAWEYPNEALLTLCWVCHEEAHKNQVVDVFDENMNKVSNYNYCSRCFGAGWFPEYKHFEGGICFRCKGAKYEQLINP